MPGYHSNTILIMMQWIINTRLPGVKASLVVQVVRNAPAMQETQVRSLDRGDPLEKRVETRSSILAGDIPGTEEPGGLQSTGSQRVGHS